MGAFRGCNRAERLPAAINRGHYQSTLRRRHPVGSPSSSASSAGDVDDGAADPKSCAARSLDFRHAMCFRWLLFCVLYGVAAITSLASPYSAALRIATAPLTGSRSTLIPRIIPPRAFSELFSSFLRTLQPDSAYCLLLSPTQINFACKVQKQSSVRKWEIP